MRRTRISEVLPLGGLVGALFAVAMALPASASGQQHVSVIQHDGSVS